MKEIKINTKIPFLPTVLTNVKKNKNIQCWQKMGRRYFYTLPVSNAAVATKFFNVFIF